jgi:hypothetical protein
MVGSFHSSPDAAPLCCADAGGLVSRRANDDSPIPKIKYAFSPSLGLLNIFLSVFVFLQFVHDLKQLSASTHGEPFVVPYLRVLLLDIIGIDIGGG